MRRPAEKGPSSTGFGVLLSICTLSFVGGGGVTESQESFFLCHRAPCPFVAFGEGNMAASVCEQLVMESWVDSQCPDWPGCGPHLVAHVLSPRQLLTTFALVEGGGGIRTLEDTGLRCVTSGTLVWVEMTAQKSRYILPTEK